MAGLVEELAKRKMVIEHSTRFGLLHAFLDIGSPETAMLAVKTEPNSGRAMP